MEPSSKAYISLARKWRPQKFEEMVGQEPISNNLKNAVARAELSHAYLFSGPRGVGKTSMARILAKALNCQKGITAEPCGQCSHCRAITAGSDMDVIEIDGATYTGIDSVRELQESIAHMPYSARRKVYIIDEVHMLSIAAFNALLKTLEEPPEFVVFVLATTEPEKIPPTILSRCQVFEFRPLEVKDIVSRLRFVVEQEKITAEPEDIDNILEALAINAEGSVRDALVSLEQLAVLGEGKINREHLNEVLGVVESDLLSNTLILIKQKATRELLHIVAELVEKGRNIERYVKNLIKFLRDILIVKSGGEVTLYSLAQSKYEQLKKQAEDYNYPFLLNLINNFFELEEKLKISSHPRFLLEFTFIKLTAIEPAVELDRMIAALEKGDFPSEAGAPGLPDWSTAPDKSGSSLRFDEADTVESDDGRTDRPSDFFGKSGEKEANSPAATEPGTVEEPAASYKAQAAKVKELVPLSMEQEIWTRLLELLKGRKAMLAHSIEEDCQLIGVEDKVVKIAVRKNAHSDYIFKMLNRRDNVELINSALKDITGQELRITIIFTDEPVPSSSSLTGQEEADPDSITPEETGETNNEDAAEVTPPEETEEERPQAPAQKELSKAVEESLKDTASSPATTLTAALKKNPELKKAVKLIEDLFEAKITKFNDKPIT